MMTKPEPPFPPFTVYVAPWNLPPPPPPPVFDNPLCAMKIGSYSFAESPPPPYNPNPPFPYPLLPPENAVCPPPPPPKYPLCPTFVPK